MSKHLLRLAMLVILATVVVSGCSESAPRPVSISGKVQLDGKSMSDGVIYFQPGNGGVPVPGKIAAGRYSLQAPPGEYRVSIQQDRDSGEKNIYGDVQMKSMVAPRYNTNTILKATVTTDATQEHHFDVHSQ